LANLDGEGKKHAAKGLPCKSVSFLQFPAGNPVAVPTAPTLRFAASPTTNETDQSEVARSAIARLCTQRSYWLGAPQVLSLDNHADLRLQKATRLAGCRDLVDDFPNQQTPASRQNPAGRHQKSISAPDWRSRRIIRVLSFNNWRMAGCATCFGSARQTGKAVRSQHPPPRWESLTHAKMQAFSTSGAIGKGPTHH